MEEKRVVPKRRFKGFEGEWRLITARELGNTYYGGGTPRTAVLEYWNGSIPWIQSSDLKEDEVELTKIKNQITVSGLNNSATKLVPANSIAIVTRVGVGKVAFISHEYSTSQDFLSIGSLNVSYKFGTYAIYRVLQEQKSAVQGTSIKGMTNDEVLSLQLFIPQNIEEQQKIGKFFKMLDERIANQERKIAKVKALKEAYLTEMFPQEGETVPKRRFKGFEGEWKKSKIEEIADRLDNLRIPIKASDRVKGDTPYYGANGIQDFVKGYTHEGENVLLAEDGANDLNDYPVYYTKGKIWVNNHAHVLKGRTLILDNLFFSYLLKTINMHPYLVGGGRAKLNSDVMMQIKCKIPSYKEQQKIGAFFKNLDDQIQAEESKLEKLKKMKEAYLEEMFV